MSNILKLFQIFINWLFLRNWYQSYSFCCINILWFRCGFNGGFRFCNSRFSPSLMSRSWFFFSYYGFSFPCIVEKNAKKRKTITIDKKKQGPIRQWGTRRAVLWIWALGSFSGIQSSITHFLNTFCITNQIYQLIKLIIIWLFMCSVTVWLIFKNRRKFPKMLHIIVIH